MLANLAVTSRTPNFRREDVAERLLPLTVTRIGEFEPEAALLDDVQARRQELVSAILADVQRALVALQDEGTKTYRTKFRMADFADFAITVAPVGETADPAVANASR